MKRPILLHPDPRLKKAAAPVADLSDELRVLGDDMLTTMYDAPGIGLAAPQIGVMLQVAVVDASEARNKRIRLANPVIIDASAVLHPYEEASPNLPGFSAVIRRPRGVKVRFLDETGAEVERDFVGLEAVSVQHQIDHLAGKMYFDNLSKTKRDMLLRKARKQNG